MQINLISPLVHPKAGKINSEIAFVIDNINKKHYIIFLDVEFDIFTFKFLEYKLDKLCFSIHALEAVLANSYALNLEILVFFKPVRKISFLKKQFKIPRKIIEFKTINQKKYPVN